MSTYLRFYRENPVTVAGRTEKCLIAFGIGPSAPHMYEGLPKKMRQEWIDNAVPTHFIETAEEINREDVGRMCRDVTPWPGNHTSTADVDQRDDGGGIELHIWLSDNDAHKAKDLITAMRFCGFVGGVVTDEAEDAA
jgi:hypothetical protein